VRVAEMRELFMGTKQVHPLFTFDFAKVGDKVPMIDFLDSINIRDRAKIFAFIEKLVELKNAGLHPKENLSKLLTDGIFEMRVSFENRIARTLYFYQADRKIIFTHGFVKNTQKTPPSEIKQANSIRNELQGAGI
jgi:phage-related protein